MLASLTEKLVECRSRGWASYNEWKTSVTTSRGGTLVTGCQDKAELYFSKRSDGC